MSKGNDPKLWRVDRGVLQRWCLKCEWVDWLACKLNGYSDDGEGEICEVRTCRCRNTMAMIVISTQAKS